MSCQHSQLLAICLQRATWSTRSRESIQYQRYYMFIWTSWDNSSLQLHPWERKWAWNCVNGVAVCYWETLLEILLMSDAFSGCCCTILQSWLICPLRVMLINLACFSLVELWIKWSGFLQMYLLFIRILRIVWTSGFQLATCSGWWLAIHFPLSTVCDLSFKSNAITSVRQ